VRGPACAQIAGGGFQIALTQPIRIGDFVVVDGESGRVEDIRLSYVVVRTATSGG
jgi:small-conductance mechanosensitive channel